jgi:NADH:ubiquinone oxidoreductase subunit 3 (subunit A)
VCRAPGSDEEDTVDDVFYIFMMIVFVVVAALFVVGCDRIIGPDDPALDELQRDDAALDCHEVAA